MKKHQHDMQICGDKMEGYQNQLWDFMDSSADEDSEETEGAYSIETGVDMVSKYFI